MRVPPLAASAVLVVALCGWLGCSVDSSGLSSQAGGHDGGSGAGGRGGAPSPVAGQSGSAGIGGVSGVAGEGQGAGGLDLPGGGGAAGQQGGTTGDVGGASGVSGLAGGGAAGAGGSDQGGKGGDFGGAGGVGTGSGGGGAGAGSSGAGGGGRGGGGGAGGRGNPGGGAVGGGGRGGGSSGLPMCDLSVRDNEQCDRGTPGCRKTCGVSALATKPCFCTSGQWDCGTCVYPPGDYSCYELPSFGIPSCPPSTMNTVTICSGICSLCSGYLDTTGTPKVGYCACSEAEASGSPVYSCASISEWPPQ